MRGSSVVESFNYVSFVGCKLNELFFKGTYRTRKCNNVRTKRLSLIKKCVIYHIT